MPKQKSTAAKSAEKTPAAKKSPRAAAPGPAGAPRSNAPRSNGPQASARQSDAHVRLSADELHRLIQEAAYFKAKARNFAPGHEVQDWIEAESEVRLRFDSAPQRQSRSA